MIPLGTTSERRERQHCERTLREFEIILMEAESLLRWLTTDPPDLDRARECAGSIVRGGYRARDVVRTLRKTRVDS